MGETGGESLRSGRDTQTLLGEQVLDQSQSFLKKHEPNKIISKSSFHLPLREEKEAATKDGRRVTGSL